MTEPTARFKRFLQDQEEAVQLARDTAEGSNSLRVDSINVALSLAHSNAVANDTATTMEQLIANARKAEKYLKGADA